MTLNSYSTETMIETVLSLRSRIRSGFMLDTHFRAYVPPRPGYAEIMFDVEDDALGIAPFVSPLREGVVVPSLGHQTKYFKPAYVKPKMPINPYAVLQRQMGEGPGGDLTALEREGVIVTRGFDDLFGRTVRRLELMAIDALVDGKVVVTGEGFEAVEVDFGRAAGHSKALTSTARWGESGVSPVDDLDDWLQLVADATGVAPDRVTMDALAWKLYSADPKFDKRRDITLAGNTTEGNPGTAIQTQGGRKRATLDDGAIEIWVYQQKYKPTGSNTITNMIPDYSVFIGTTDARCTGTRHFGTILDPSLGYSSTALRDPQSGMPLEFAPKTWVTDDPAQRMIMLQCAPLTALTRPNSTLYASVR